ncbi:MAG: sensor domain-containing diguanylate cyclase [Leptospirales bacterium]|nr:sensor domain-containing diguanylate cyclase [Leptospirales bacterium]
MEPISELEKLRRENQRLHRALELNALLSSSLDLGVVLDSLMGLARDLLEAEASSLMLLDEASQELYFHTVKGEKSEAIKTIRLKLGEGIAGWVAREGKPVLVADAASDPRFYRRADQSSGFVTRSMMCAPLKARRRIVGTVQVLNKRDGNLFTEQDLALFEILANQAAIAIENARLHTMATVDGMTGLYIKSYFQARMEEEFRRSKNTGQPLSLLMSDIDFFKKVNDNYGHQGGDAALIELARVIKDTVHRLGSDDMAGRYGGEEFCVLLPQSGPERALEVGEMIRKNIETNAIPIGDREAHITISIGVSSFPLHDGQIQGTEDFIRLADEALYLCKNRGRNCVALYETAQ